MHHFEIDRMAQDRIHRFQQEAEQVRLAQNAEPRSPQPEIRFRRRLGILLMRWGSQLAGYNG